MPKNNIIFFLLGVLFSTLIYIGILHLWPRTPSAPPPLPCDTVQQQTTIIEQQADGYNDSLQDLQRYIDSLDAVLMDLENDTLL